MSSKMITDGVFTDSQLTKIHNSFRGLFDILKDKMCSTTIKEVNLFEAAIVIIASKLVISHQYKKDELVDLIHRGVDDFIRLEYAGKEPREMSRGIFK